MYRLFAVVQDVTAIGFNRLPVVAIIAYTYNCSRKHSAPNYRSSNGHRERSISDIWLVLTVPPDRCLWLQGLSVSCLRLVCWMNVGMVSPRYIYHGGLQSVGLVRSHSSGMFDRRIIEQKFT